MFPIIPSAMTAGAAQLATCLITAVLVFCTFLLHGRT